MRRILALVGCTAAAAATIIGSSATPAAAVTAPEPIGKVIRLQVRVVVEERKAKTAEAVTNVKKIYEGAR
jgi:hypothetical protein